MYYDNFQEVRFRDPHCVEVFKHGLCHHDWLLDYDGEAYQLDKLEEIYYQAGYEMEDSVIEMDWRNLKEID